MKEEKITPKIMAAEWSKLFEAYRNKRIRVTIEGSNVKPFTSELVGFRLGKAGEMENPPDKRQRDGKFYTPPCFLLQFKDGELYLSMEDMGTPLIQSKGLCIPIGEMVLCFTESEDNAHRTK